MNNTNDIAIKEQYDTIRGANTIDIGSVLMLRKIVNAQLAKRGYRKLKGYKSKLELLAIFNKYNV